MRADVSGIGQSYHCLLFSGIMTAFPIASGFSVSPTHMESESFVINEGLTRSVYIVLVHDLTLKVRSLYCKLAPRVLHFLQVTCQFLVLLFV